MKVTRFQKLLSDADSIYVHEVAYGSTLGPCSVNDAFPIKLSYVDDDYTRYEWYFEENNIKAAKVKDGMVHIRTDENEEVQLTFYKLVSLLPTKTDKIVQTILKK